TSNQFFPRPTFWGATLLLALVSMGASAAPESADAPAVPSSSFSQADNKEVNLTPAQIKYIEARMDARSTMASGKTQQQAMVGFAKHFNQATDLKILSFAALVGSSV